MKPVRDIARELDELAVDRQARGLPLPADLVDLRERTHWLIAESEALIAKADALLESSKK